MNTTSARTKLISRLAYASLIAVGLTFLVMLTGLNFIPESIRSIALTVFLVVIMVGYVTYSIITYLYYSKKIVEEYNSEKQAMESILTTEPTPVLLHSSSTLPKTDFKCTARKTENGEIYVNVEFNKEFKLKDINELYRFFDIPSNK